MRNGNGRITTLAAAAVAFGGMAHAAGGGAGTEARYGAYSKVSEQKLMLTGEVESDLPRQHFRRLYGDLGLNRFNRSVKASDPNDPAVVAWCERAVRDTQARRDEVDGETGEAEVTLAAKVARCSQVFKHDLRVTHGCQTVSPRKGSPFIRCTVEAEATIYKYRAVAGGDGRLRYEIDRDFGDGGKEIKTSSGSGTGTLKGRTAAQATHAALRGAAIMAGLFLKRALRDIRAFQLTAPVIAARGGYALGCLGRETTELDTPFYVVFRTPAGEARSGFAKARRIHDGCTLTPTMEEAEARGEQFDVRPMEAEIIIGRGRVRPGHTLREMPSIGLSVGGFGGIAGTVGFFDGNIGPGGGIAIEFNLAPYLGISELHVVSNTQILVNLDDGPIMKAFRRIPELDGVVESAPFAIQADVGLLKRFYVVGRLFFDLGLAFTFSYYSVNLAEGLEDRYSVGLYAIGGAGELGLGFQVAPRVLIRLAGGFRVGVTLPRARDDIADVEIPLDNARLGLEIGPVGRLALLFTI